jgi:hypothetical protein
MELYTQDGSRPDLAQLVRLSQEALGGYAFPLIFPVISVPERAGQLSYAPAGLSNAGGVTGRANGAPLESSEKKTSDFGWTTARLEARTKIYADEVKGFGGIEMADQFGGEDCGRRAFNTIEMAAAAMVFSSARRAAAVSLTNHQLVPLLQKAALAQRKYGSPYLVLTTNGLLKLTQIPEVFGRMVGRFGATGAMNFLAGAAGELTAALSPLMGFAGMLVFDSGVVGETYDNSIAVASLRPDAAAGGPAAMQEIKRSATYGFAAVYIPDPASNDQPLEISSHADRAVKANVYDAEGRYSLNEIHGTDGAEAPNVNGGAVKVFAMLADAEGYTPLDQRTVQVEITNTAASPVPTQEVSAD